jgi:hypothetical protein
MRLRSITHWGLILIPPLLLIISLHREIQVIRDKLGKLEQKVRSLKSQGIVKAQSLAGSGPRFQGPPASLKIEKTVKERVERILTDTLAEKDIQQMVNNAVRSYLNNEAGIGLMRVIYDEVEFLCDALKIEGAKKDKFYTIMIDFHRGYEQILAGFKSLDRSSRQACKHKIEQLKGYTKERLKTVLTPEQLNELEILLPR